MTPRWYRALIRLLPRNIRERDGVEMARTLADQIAESPAPMRVRWRALRRFPLVLFLEWRDELLSNQTKPRGHVMESLGRMIKQGARSLARTPAFSLSVILLLGVGVGSVSAIFAVVDHVLLRPLPYPGADRLFVVENGSHSVPAIKDLQSMSSVEAWGAARTSNANMTGVGEPLRVRLSAVTDGFFPMFGARAELGRLIVPADSSTGNVAVLSHGTWKRVFGGDSSVIGRTIRVDDKPLTIVGVIANDFAEPEAISGANVDMWTPIDASDPYMTDRGHWAFNVAGRLKAHASFERAKAEAARVARDRARAFPDNYMNKGTPIELPLVTLQESTTGNVSESLKVLLGAVTVLLLVACVNVTHLFLARGATRVREMALRRALGAGTRAILAQLLTESALIGSAGVLVGIGIAYGGVRAFLAMLPAGFPRVSAIAVDGGILLFASAIGVATSITFGLVPALRLARPVSTDSLRSANRSVTGGRAARTFRNALVVLEVALSLVLVAQAGWLIRSFIRMSNVELGFDTRNVLVVPLNMTDAKDPSEWSRRLEAMRASIAEARGVDDVAFGMTMPLQWVGGGRCCWSQRPAFAGKDRPEKSAAFHTVSENYFELLGIRMIAGSAWTRAASTASPMPVVLNEQLANQMFGNANAALGAVMTISKQTFHVVGVAANTRHYGADQPFGTAAYLPAAAVPFSPGNATFAVRTRRSDSALPADLRNAIWRSEPRLPVPTIRAFSEMSRRDSARRRFDSILFGTFSVVALLLVAGGLAGTLLYRVSLERRSLGIRLALGATPGTLERGVLTSGVGLAAIGVVFGTAGAWYAGRFIEARLYGVEARDVRTLAIAVAVLMVSALISSWVPARRAAGTNPIESLRAE
jgi:predicted permease